jgi:hypothetical protein
MKNYLIAFLLVVILALSSLIYKNSHSTVERIYFGFPLTDIEESIDVDVPLYLFLFFSNNNCPPCLEIIEVLNSLPSQFKVMGIVPEHELKKESNIRNQTGAVFKLIGVKNYRKYATLYTPTLLGVSGAGKIFFVIPAVPGLKVYLVNFLESFYKKAYTLLIHLIKKK